jgi:hypothetical protein
MMSGPPVNHAGERVLVRLGNHMKLVFSTLRVTFSTFVLLGVCISAHAQAPAIDQNGFGPVVKAYLGYLRNEQEVVDDRASRHEVSPSYYRRNSNRIRALRQMAIRIARETENDYLPELEAVTRDEFGLLFDRPVNTRDIHVGEVLSQKFRFLGNASAGENFYLFARLDPYEQAELIQSQPVAAPSAASQVSAEPPNRQGRPMTRSRRVNQP